MAGLAANANQNNLQINFQMRRLNDDTLPPEMPTRILPNKIMEQFCAVAISIQPSAIGIVANFKVFNRPSQSIVIPHIKEAKGTIITVVLAEKVVILRQYSHLKMSLDTQTPK